MQNDYFIPFKISKKCEKKLGDHVKCYMKLDGQDKMKSS